MIELYGESIGRDPGLYSLTWVYRYWIFLESVKLSPLKIKEGRKGWREEEMEGGSDGQKEGGSECTKKRLLSAELTQTCRVSWRNRHFSDGCKM